MHQRINHQANKQISKYTWILMCWATNTCEDGGFRSESEPESKADLCTRK